MAHPDTRQISFTFPPVPFTTFSVLGPTPTLSPSFLLAQAIFEPNLFPYKYSNILKPSHSSYLSAYEVGTECSETPALKFGRRKITQKKAYNIQNKVNVWN
jgi:hypothetical protein